MKEILRGLAPAIYVIYIMYIIKLYSDHSILTHYELDNSKWTRTSSGEKAGAMKMFALGAGVVVVVVGGGGRRGGIRNNSNWGIATYTGDSFQTDRTGRSTA